MEIKNMNPERKINFDPKGHKPKQSLKPRPQVKTTKRPKAQRGNACEGEWCLAIHGLKRVRLWQD